MALADDYRVLGLRTGAAFDEIKAAYRRLARQYHPDVNPGNQRAKERFIQITKAYESLADQIEPAPTETASPPVSAAPRVTPTVPSPSVNPHAAQSPAPAAPKPQVNGRESLNQQDYQLKQTFYEQLQTLFQAQRFPRAVALVEGLAQRLPQDYEVRQWQAITYQRWGRHLIHQGSFDQAERYLHKALRTDPHNKSLRQAVTQDLNRLHQARQRASSSR